MKVLRVRNVHEALPRGIEFLRNEGEQRDSRNGPVMVSPEPVCTIYEKPLERVLYWQARDANPFLHFFESLWMLAGRNDIKFLTQFAKNMANYSDDGKTMNGAYGHRWMQYFQTLVQTGEDKYDMQILDQLAVIAAALKANPDDRRNVLAMWDGHHDLGLASKDLPCNTHAYFLRGSDGALNMTVSNRSNDIIWGAYGANAVHFSFLQEYMAAAIGCPVGRYWQMSNNYHGYLETLEPLFCLTSYPAGADDPYARGDAVPYPLVSTDIKTWREDLSIFMEQGPITGFRDPFFTQVATPLWHAHRAFKEGKTVEDKFDRPLEILQQCKASDWRIAANDWIVRRMHKWAKAREDGVPHD